MMEQLAAQRQRFMKSAMEPDAAENSNSDSISRENSQSFFGEESSSFNEVPSAKEYTCCHCLSHGPATEDRPIGLVTWIQVLQFVSL
jgi:hypothetical protein